jgi:hypothetical protein
MWLSSGGILADLSLDIRQRQQTDRMLNTNRQTGCQTPTDRQDASNNISNRSSRVIGEQLTAISTSFQVRT